MQASLYFKIRTGYLLTVFEPVSELAMSRVYLKDEKEYEWTFSVMNLKKVAALLGEEIVIPEQQLNAVSKYGKRLVEVKQVEAYKGKGSFEVKERTPKLFIIETVIRKKVVRKEVPSESVAVLWAIMLRYPVDKFIDIRTVAEHYVDCLGVTRFHRQSGTFDWEKLLGARSFYFQLYYGLKVLQSDAVIEHTKDGKVARLKDAWDAQVKLEVGNDGKV